MHKLSQCRRQAGAALLAVLVVALILVLLMGVASHVMQSRLVLAQDSKQNWKNHAAAYTKRSELIYLLATQRRTVVGISKGQAKPELSSEQALTSSFAPIGDEIRTDGFLYEDESGVQYSVQNTTGLIGINSPNQTWLKAWLTSQGYSRSEQAKFTDSLADHADPDNIRRAAGAEANQLFASDKNTLTAPGNFLLQSCSELWRVKNWGALLTASPKILDFCSLRRNETLNLNAVPLSLWQMLWPNSAKKVANSRANNNWFLSYQDIINTEPAMLATQDNYYTYISGRTFKLLVNMGKTKICLIVEINKGRVTPYWLKNDF